MSIMRVLAIVAACWVVASVPLAFLVARFFRAGHQADRPRRVGDTHGPSHRNAA